MKQIAEAGDSVTLSSSQIETAALRSVRLLADEAQKELSQNADRGTSARPTVKQLNDTLDHLREIVRLMDEVVLPAFDLPPIQHASDIEKRIVGKLVKDLLAGGYTIGVNDGEDDVVAIGCTDAATIYKALSSSDIDSLLIRKPGTDLKSFVMLVWGNDCDVISDYGTSLATVLDGANKLAEALQ